MMLAQDWLAECMVNQSFIKGELHGVYLCGSSAGGHLAAMMLAQDWLAECMVNHSFIKGELSGLVIQ